MGRAESFPTKKAAGKSVVLMGIYLLGALQVLSRGGEPEFLAPEKIAYMAVFAITVLLWLFKGLEMGNLFQPFEQEPINILLLFMLFYYNTVVPLWGIYYDIPFMSAFRGQIRLLNLVLIPIIYSELRDREQIWRLFLFFFIIVAICSIFDIFEIMIQVKQHRFSFDIEGGNGYYYTGFGFLLGIYPIMQKKFRYMIVFLALLTLFSVRIFLSFERIHLALIFIIVCLAILIHLAARGGIPRIAIYALGGVVVLGLLGLYLQYKYDIFNVVIYRFGLLDRSLRNRWEEWSQALDGFFKNPLFGKGGGSTITIVREQSDWGTLNQDEVVHVHNIFFYHLFHAGLIGSLLYFGLWWGFFLRTWRLLRWFRLKKRDFAVITCIFLGVTSILSDSLVHTYFMRQETNFLFALYIAIILRYTQIYHREQLAGEGTRQRLSRPFHPGLIRARF